jgi:hypothetical protein
MTTWAGYEIQATGNITSCNVCGGFLKTIAPTNLIPVYYAYFIGYLGHANGLQDQNVNPNGPNLANGMGAVILGAANLACPSGQICAQNKIVQAYAYYAQQSHTAWPTKPLVWLLEGDFVQYTDATQSQPLTMAQLGQLAALITTAIKSNMPNAVVAIDQSNWNSDAVSTAFWAAMSQANYDLVWTTGVGNNGGFLTPGTTSSSRNGKTANYAWLHATTGRKIFVDQWSPDTWSTQSAATVNALIGNGVIALNSQTVPSGYQASVTALEPTLTSTCP